jgi:leader peptidase (prepilin peptidase)/N-methyltransferase
MSAQLALLGGATIGMAVGALLIPLTRRELSAAVVRADQGSTSTHLKLLDWHLVAMVVASGVLPGLVLLRTGWSIVVIPLLLLLLGLVQLAYCDMTRFLLPKSMVHATTAAVALSATAVAAVDGEWHRLLVAAGGGAVLFALLFAINLMNPAWMAFGDVRLAPAVGMGLAWIGPQALFQGFFLANVLAAVVGLLLIVIHRGGRKTALPFGLYLAIASAVVIFYWS